MIGEDTRPAYQQWKSGFVTITNEVTTDVDSVGQIVTHTSSESLRLQSVSEDLLLDLVYMSQLHVKGLAVLHEATIDFAFRMYDYYLALTPAALKGQLKASNLTFRVASQDGALYTLSIEPITEVSVPCVFSETGDISISSEKLLVEIKLQNSLISAPISGVLTLAFFITSSSDRLDLLTAQLSSFEACRGDVAQRRMLQEAADEHARKILPAVRPVPAVSSMTGSGRILASTVLNNQVVLLGVSGSALHEKIEPKIEIVDTADYDGVMYLSASQVGYLIDKICDQIPHDTPVQYQTQGLSRRSLPSFNPSEQTISVVLGYWYKIQGGSNPLEWEINATAAISAEFTLGAQGTVLVIEGSEASSGAEEITWTSHGVTLSESELDAIFSLADFTGILKSILDRLTKQPTTSSLEASFDTGVAIEPRVLADMIAILLKFPGESSAERVA